MPKPCFAILLLAACAFAEPPKLRLGDDVRPVRYRLDLTVIPQQDTFTGTIEIDLQVRKATDAVWLNARDLTIDAAQLTVGGLHRQISEDRCIGRCRGFDIDDIDLCILRQIQRTNRSHRVINPEEWVGTGR